MFDVCVCVTVDCGHDMAKDRPSRSRGCSYMRLPCYQRTIYTRIYSTTYPADQGIAISLGCSSCPPPMDPYFHPYSEKSYPCCKHSLTSGE